MAGLLDFTQTPEGMQGLALLAAAAPSMEPTNFAGRLAQAGNVYTGLLGNQQKSKYMQLLADKNGLELDQLRQQIADEKASRDVMRNFYAGSGVPGLRPQGGGATGAVNAGLPSDLQIGAMPATPGFQQQPSAGVTPKVDLYGQYKALSAQFASAGLGKQAQQYAELAEKYRPKYNTTPQQMMVNGKLTNVLVGEDGTTKTLDGFDVKPDMVEQDLGGFKQWVDKNRLQSGQSFAKTMTPGEVASNQLGWANNRATLRGQDLTDQRAREQIASGKVPSGYRQTADGGLEFIPGGPADPASAKKAAPTEFQGKSTTFAARMQDAARTIDALQSEVSPSQVAQAGYKPNFPNWLPGGQVLGAGLAAANKSITPEKAQQYRQAQENWVTANLRQESGAAIGKDEMEKDIAKWFPQPNEPESVIKQKAAARKVAERAMVVQAGPGASAIPEIVGDTPAPTTSSGADWRFENGKLVKVKK